MDIMSQWVIILSLMKIVVQEVSAGTCGSSSYQCSATFYSSQRYTVSCGSLGWSRCSQYRSRSYSGYKTCYTPICCSGWTNHPSCNQDINECSSNNGGCEHTCVNTAGSYHCTCNQGYQLSGSKNCVDINECSSNNGGCEHACVNTAGSYHCTCNQGYQLSGNKNCVDINECSSNNGGCEHACVNTAGSYHCTCNQGYQLSGNKNCVDIDECATNNGNCDQLCINTVGSYSCACPKYGFKMDDNLHSCIDTNPVVKEYEGLTGVRLDSFVYKTVNVRSRLECSAKCIHDSTCRSFNIAKELNEDNLFECELNTEKYTDNTEHSIQENKNYDCYNVSD